MENIRAKIDELLAAFEAEGLKPDIDIWIHQSGNPGCSIEKNVDIVQSISGESASMYFNDYDTVAKARCGNFGIYTFTKGDQVLKGVAYRDGNSSGN